jgi:phosphatidylinositol-3,4,5-trisphosphate 3-phosphatase/dual-specificity protein phosphatase PTEN
MLMFCIPALNVAQVTIASQRRYVGYWGKLMACSSGPQIELPETRHRELRRIRLYDTLSNDHVKFVISELKKVKVEKLQAS